MSESTSKQTKKEGGQSVRKQRLNPISSTNDERLLGMYQIPVNRNLDDYAMSAIRPGSLFIRNGVMYILGGVSSGKSTLMSKLIGAYNKILNPITVCFYAGLTPDETTTFALNSFNIRPYFVRLSTPEAMYSFFDQFRYKRLKLAELLMFLLSVFKDDTELLLDSVQYVEDLNIQDKQVAASDKRMKALLLYVSTLITSRAINIDPSKRFIYLSEFINKEYSRRHKVSFSYDPAHFISRCLISFAKGFHEQTITVDVLNDPSTRPLRNANSTALLNRFHPYTFKPFLRVVTTRRRVDKPMKGDIRLAMIPEQVLKQSGERKERSDWSELDTKIELVPSISIFDDVAQFPLLTAERSNQWTKDLFAETRRWQNTFVIAAQRHNLLNKTLRSLTHTFFVGYSLVDDDIPHIAKEIPSNLLSGREFVDMYTHLIKPFTFFVYNNKLGYNILHLRRDNVPNSAVSKNNKRK